MNPLGPLWNSIIVRIMAKGMLVLITLAISFAIIFGFAMLWYGITGITTPTQDQYGNAAMFSALALVVCFLIGGIIEFINSI